MKLTTSKPQFNNNFLLNGVGNPLKTTDKYKSISSIDMIESFNDVGYEVREIQKPLARNKENLPFNKHIIRLVKQGETFQRQETPEIVIINNNNNRGKLKVMLGIFRMICSNGIILGDSFFNQNVRHDNNFLPNLHTALSSADDNYHRIGHIISELKNIDLPNSYYTYEQFIMNEVVRPMLLRPNTEHLTIEDHFNPLRYEDNSKDAWTQFNKLQERIIRGGISYHRIDIPTKRVRHGEYDFDEVRSTTREIKGVDRLVKVNQLLMDKTLDYFDVAI